MATPLGEIITERARVLGEEGRPLTLREMADRTGIYKGGPINYSTISDYINGVTRPRSARLRLLALGLAGDDVDSDTLYRQMADASKVLPGDGQEVIDLPDVAELTHHQVRLVEDLVRALAAGNRGAEARQLRDHPGAESDAAPDATAKPNQRKVSRRARRT